MESRRRYLGRLGVLLVVVKLALFVSAQDCLLAAEGRVPPFRNNKRNPRLPNETQSIITSYRFRCCGSITAWQTYVRPGGRMHQGVYDIYFQVWRPSPTVQENGCYSMVGENRYTRISLGRGGLVSEIPEPSNILTVQHGDVVGYFTISRKGVNEGIQLKNDDSQSVDSVWYETITGSELLNAGAPHCPFPVGAGTDRILASFTNAAPVLSVNISTFTCPPTPAISRSSSSPSSSSLPPPSMIATTTSVQTQLSNIIPQTFTNPTSLPSHTAITSLALSVSISILSTPTISEGLSNPVIARVAVVVSSALLFTLLSTLIIAIAIAKVQHKRQNALAETSSTVTDPQVNILSMNMQGNEAYTLNSQVIDAIEINTESNLAYDAVKKENGVTTPSSQGTDEIALTDSHIYEPVRTYSELSHPEEHYYYLREVHHPVSQM